MYIMKTMTLRAYEKLTWKNPEKFIILRIPNEPKCKIGEKIWIRFNGTCYKMINVKHKIVDIKIIRFSDILDFENWILCNSKYYRELVASDNVSENFKNALNLMRKIYTDFEEDEIVQILYVKKIHKLKSQPSSRI